MSDELTMLKHLTMNGVQLDGIEAHVRVAVKRESSLYIVRLYGQQLEDVYTLWGMAKAWLQVSAASFISYRLIGTAEDGALHSYLLALDDRHIQHVSDTTINDFMVEHGEDELRNFHIVLTGLKRRGITATGGGSDILF